MVSAAHRKDHLTVGVIGGSGYAGGELLRLLLSHPQVKITWVTSRGADDLARQHRHLAGSTLRFVREEEVGPCDAVFLCVPATVAMTYVPRFLEQGACVIDLSADFRLRDQHIYHQVYQHPHSAFHLMDQAVLGIPELYRSQLRGAKLIANPGCFAITSILALAPLMAKFAAEVELNRLVVDGCSGTSGAGAQPISLIHHAEIATSIQPYNVIDHRHTYEIEQELSAIAGQPVMVHFTASHGPFVRGILATTHAFFAHLPTREALLDAYQEFYEHEPFIRVLRFAREEASYVYEPYPSCGEVQGSNFCHIGLDVDPTRSRAVIFSATDNLMKGAAGNAIQCMNVAFGLPENCGLAGYGLHP
jgi:N-acetyl-gamma-glutamyl-phosphate reductase